jgi:hypothetical protein
LRKVSEQQLRAALAASEGDPLPGSKEDTEERIEKISGVVRARLEAVCCFGGRPTLFVGVEERGAPQFALRTAPAGSVLLPDEILDAYHGFIAALESAAAKGKTSEDLTGGHALSVDPDTRKFEERFLVIAAANLPLLREVIQNSADEEHRAAASYIMGYAPRKAEVVNDLQAAMQDPDPAVRSNAMRALKAVAVLAVREPSSGIRVPATWFIEMLNSILVSDRYRAALALETLTEKRPESEMAQLRTRALASVAEMARWNTLNYALPAFILAGRMAGLPEETIRNAWKSGDREEVVDQLLGRKKKR